MQVQPPSNPYAQAVPTRQADTLPTPFGSEQPSDERDPFAAQRPGGAQESERIRLPGARGRGEGGTRADSEGVRVSVSARGQELSEEEQAQVAQLKQRDREVRAHEAAHLAAAGAHARGGASFEFQTGPDGQRYAVGGEVSIDSSPVKDDPEATALKMQQIQRAALAPAQPSGQDQAVAAAAARTAQSARAETAKESLEAQGAPGEAPKGPEDLRSATGSPAAGESAEAGTCPACGGSGHDAAAHERPVNTFA